VLIGLFFVILELFSLYGAIQGIGNIPDFFVAVVLGHDYDSPNHELINPVISPKIFNHAIARRWQKT
jgi:hypothetical protein